MRTRFVAFLSLLLFAAINAPLLGIAAGADSALRVGGSTTLLPLVADAASFFMDKYRTWDKVNPNLPKERILIYVTGGGSGFGISSAMNGTFDIGLSSRPLKKEEETKLGEHRQFLISQDCLAFAANVNSPLAKATDNLSRDMAAKIVSGEAQTWRDVRSDLPATPIVLVIRDAASGSSEMVKQIVLADKGFSPKGIQVPSQGANLKRLEGNANAFGYLSSVVAGNSDQLRVFKFEGVAATNETINSGAYPITRPLIMIVKGQPSPLVEAFVNFIYDEGQEIIKEYGYVPVKKP
jgi:phosphate transport system substrate-binding protein